MQIQQRFSFFDLRRNPVFQLSLFWVLGLTSGFVVFRASHMEACYLSFAPAEFFPVMVCNLFPFVLSVICMYLGRAWLLLAIVFVKAFSFGFVSCLICYLYSGFGWLARWLFMFSDLIGMLLLIPLWLRMLSANSSISVRQAIAYFSSILLIVCMDYSCISPLLQRLLLC